MATWKNKWDLINITPFQTNGISGEAVRDFVNSGNLDKVDTADINGKLYTNVKLSKHSFLSTVLLFNQEIKGLERNDSNKVTLYEGYVEGENTPVITWEKKEETKYIEITTVNETDPSMYEDEQIVEDGIRGEVLVTYEAEYSDGIATGNIRNKQETTKIQMQPKRIIRGTKKHVYDWKKESHKETIEVTEKIEYNNKKFQDEPDEIIPGIAGEKIITYEYEYKDGIKTGNKRNRTEEITVPMIQTRRIKGTRKVIPENLKVGELFKETLQNQFIQTDWRITIDGKMYDSNIFKSYPSLNKSTKRMFGDFIMAQCDFELNDRENKLDVLNKEVLIERLIRVDGIGIWYKFGYFIIKETISDKSGLSIKCKSFDRAVLFNEKYESENIYSEKGIDLINRLLAKRGVKMNGSFSFADYTFENINFPPDISEREVIARMAELGGEHALINKEGFLEFRKPKEIEVVINGEHRTEYSLEKSDKPIGQVSLGFKDYDDDYVKGTNLEGEQTFRIENNPYTELIRDKIIDKIYENIHGMQARSFDIKEVIGAEFFEINDVFYLNDNQGVKQKLTVLSIKTDGTIKGNISAEKIEYSSANYKIAGSVKADLKKVGLEVNHINQTIKSQATRISNTTELVSQTIQDINGVKTKVSSIEEKGNTLEKKYTELNQNIDNLTIEVKSSGGSNLIKNSVAHNTDRKQILQLGNSNEKAPFIAWYYQQGDWEAVDDIESKNYGCISGRKIYNSNPDLSNSIADKIIVKIPVSANKTGESIVYSISLRAKKLKGTKLEINIKNGVLPIRIFKSEENEELYWTEVKLEGIKTTHPDLYIEILAEGGSVEFSDLMCNVGSKAISWTTHTSEAVSSSVVADAQGLKVKAFGYDGETKIDGQGLAGIYNNERIFGINKDITWSDKFEARKEITMSPIKVVPVNSGSYKGWIFVSNE